jgi:hypothetical protein
MRKDSWRVTRCYYLSLEQSYSVLAHCTLLEMLDVFSLYDLLEESIRYYCKSSKKIKQSHYRPGLALRVPEC